MSGIRIYQVGATMQEDRVHAAPFWAGSEFRGGTISIGNEQMYQRVIEQIRLTVVGQECADLSMHGLSPLHATDKGLT